MRRILLLVALLSCASWAQAPNVSHHTNGSDLLDYCQAAVNHESGGRAGICLGYINAYRDLAAMLPDAQLLCLPDGIGNEQFIRILLKYLDQHPEKLHLPAAQLVYDAMQDVFPCKP